MREMLLADRVRRRDHRARRTLGGCFFNYPYFIPAASAIVGYSIFVRSCCWAASLSQCAAWRLNTSDDGTSRCLLPEPLLPGPLAVSSDSLVLCRPRVVCRDSTLAQIWCYHLAAGTLPSRRAWIPVNRTTATKQRTAIASRAACRRKGLGGGAVKFA